MPKYLDIAKLLETRIRHGDYALMKLPGEVALAEEAGVSRMTARKALEHLTGKGILVKKSNGRREINRHSDSPATRLQVAFLAPAYTSPHADRLRIATERSVHALGGRLRPIEYVHCEDPLIGNTLETFDGVFLVSQPEALSDRVFDLLKGPPCRVVALDVDMTSHGIPSIQIWPPVFIQHLLDHLDQQGHRNIDCFNVQPLHPEIQGRIRQWQLWTALHNVEGELINEPVEIFGDAAHHACSVMKRRLKTGDIKGSALLTLTESAAFGASRALQEAGYKLGRDISLCTVGDTNFYDLFCPSITALAMPDPQPYLQLCLQWMRNRSQPWVGPLLLQPSQPELFIGESTGRADPKSE